MATNKFVEPRPESLGFGIVPFYELGLCAHAARRFASYGGTGTDAVVGRCHLFWNFEAGITGAMLDVIGENFRQSAEGRKIFLRYIPLLFSATYSFHEMDACSASPRNRDVRFQLQLCDVDYLFFFVLLLFL